MTKSTLPNRREALKLAAAAVSSLAPSQASGLDRVRLGVIGSGNRGQALMRAFTLCPEVEITAISDVNEPVMDQALAVLDKLPGRFRPAKFVEYESILQRKDVDAVLIATPEQWHGLPFILACQAGKHIYCEKPVSHNVVEGRRMVQAARKSGVIAQVGTQQRASPHFRRAMEIVQSGRLGQISKVHCWNTQQPGTRYRLVPDSEPPAGLHWDRWLGPARKVPFNAMRIAEHRLWMDYAGGEMTDWGAHHLDIIMGAMRASAPEAVTCTTKRFNREEAGDAPDFHEAMWDFPGFVLTYSFSKLADFHWARRPYDHGICFNGSEATLIVDRYGFDIWTTKDRLKDSVLVETMPRENPDERTNVVGLDRWARQFVDAVRKGGPSPLDIEESHRSTVPCLLANIAARTGRRLKWRAEDETIPGDPEASAQLSEPRRKGYELPLV
jgi:predicted dehydrogenase